MFVWFLLGNCMSIFWPILYSIFIWWFSTGIILLLNQRHPSTYKNAFWVSGMVLALALVGLKTSANLSSVAGAYCGFTCAILVWGWQEIGFLFGYVTGPRREPCPENCRGWQKMYFAFKTIQHHEIALVILALAVTMMTWGGSNQTGFWTFMILWLMRQSAKLNIFLGVLNLNERFLPNHLKYIFTYFTCKPMNPLLPLSVIGGVLCAIPLWQAAAHPSSSDFRVASMSLTGAILSLAVLEHILMVVPFSSERLWKWGMRS